MSELALKLIAENKETHATFLDLGNCGLTEVPDKIGELVWLEVLVLGRGWWDGKEWRYSRNNVNENNLEELNQELTNLKNLKEIYLGENRNLTDISLLTKIESLQKIIAYGTGINNLSELSNLKSLQQIDLARTKITNIQSLAKLTSLRQVDLSRTQVEDISPLQLCIERNVPVKWEIGYPWNGEGIYVASCPLTNPPKAIVKQGNEAILNYFKEKQQQGTEHLYEAKLLIIGAGGAGKTSLIRRLYQPDQPLPEEKDSTKGIDIHQQKFTVTDSRYPNGREFRLNVWDFGGQDIYHATHQFFLTQRSLYVLLDDTRHNGKSVQDPNFKYWLEVVDLLSNHSPVLIFQNEKGGRSKQIDLVGIKSRFANVISKNDKDCYAGNLENKNAADQLRDALELYAKQLPHIGEELPAKWINIRADIEQHAQQKPTISLDEYFELYAKHLPYDETKALHLSHYLHDLGVFLHFQDDELLNQTVILQNTWATEAVFKMLDDETVKAKFGRFDTEDCQRLWQDSVYKRMHLQLRALMEKFELCYLLPDSNPKTWLAPQLLPASKPPELNDWAKIGDLVLRYRYEFLPKGMINRLMVRKHNFVPQPDLAWLTGVLFERNGTQVLVELSAQGNEIVFRARGIERKDLLSHIAFDLEELNATFKGLPDKVTVLIPCCCSSCQNKQEPETFEKKRLLERKEDNVLTIECPSRPYEKVNVLELLDGVQVEKLPDWSKEQTMKKIFISYSKDDKAYKDTLLKQLSSLRRSNKVAIWHDEDLLAGEKWDERIKEELHNADIVLYLISSNSLATDYIYNIELPIIKQRCDEGKCKFVPIIVKPCDWTEEECAKYNALPRKGKPVTAWENQDDAWATIVQELKKIV